MIVEFPYLQISNLIKKFLNKEENRIDDCRRFFFMLQIIDSISDTSLFLKKISSYLPTTNFSMTLLLVYLFSDLPGSLLFEEVMTQFFINEDEYILDDDKFLILSLQRIRSDPVRYQNLIDSLNSQITSEEMLSLNDILSKKLLLGYLSTGVGERFFEKRRDERLSSILSYILSLKREDLPLSKADKSLIFRGFANYLSSISP